MAEIIKRAIDLTIEEIQERSRQLNEEKNLRQEVEAKKARFEVLQARLDQLNAFELKEFIGLEQDMRTIYRGKYGA